MAIKRLNRKGPGQAGMNQVKIPRRRSVEIHPQDGLLQGRPYRRSSNSYAPDRGALYKQIYAAPHVEELSLVDRIFWVPAKLTTDKRMPYKIHPSSMFMNAWNLINAVFIVICALFLPFQMAFDYTVDFGGKPDQVAWAIIWPFMDAYFFIDIVVNFRLCYFEGAEFEQNTFAIFQNYLSTWFWVDFLSSISSVLELITAGLGIGRNMRILKLLKLMKLLRLARLKRLIESFGDMASDAKLGFGLFKLLISVCAFAHIIGCGWWSIGVWNEESKKTWYYQYYDNAEALTTADKYWGSVYWAIMTITTVGYGDITPSNNMERQYALFTCFVGTALFAFITGEITALATTKHASQQALVAKLDAWKEFMAYHRLPKQLSNVVRDYYRNSFHKGYFSSEDILNDLPTDLARQVETAIDRTRFVKFPWFRVVSLEKTYNVSLTDTDTAILRSMSQSTDQPIELHTLQHKKEYEVIVTIREQMNQPAQFKAPARELTYISDGEHSRVEWVRRLKKTDAKHKAVHSLFNFREECMRLYSSLVEALTVRQVTTNTVVYSKGSDADEVAFLEEGDVRMEGTAQYIMSGSWVGLCDKSTTKGEGGRIVFTKSLIASTRCTLLVLTLEDLRHTLEAHGHAELAGMHDMKKVALFWSAVKHTVSARTYATWPSTTAASITGEPSTARSLKGRPSNASANVPEVHGLVEAGRPSSPSSSSSSSSSSSNRTNLTWSNKCSADSMNSSHDNGNGKIHEQIQVFAANMESVKRNEVSLLLLQRQMNQMSQQQQQQQQLLELLARHTLPTKVIESFQFSAAVQPIRMQPATTQVKSPSKRTVVQSPSLATPQGAPNSPSCSQQMTPREKQKLKNKYLPLATED